MQPFQKPGRPSRLRRGCPATALSPRLKSLGDLLSDKGWVIHLGKAKKKPRTTEGAGLFLPTLHLEAIGQVSRNDPRSIG